MEAQLRAKQVRVVLAPYVIPPWDVHVIYPRQRHQSAKLRAVVEALREKFATVSWALKDQSS